MSNIALIIGHDMNSGGAVTVNGVNEYSTWFTYLNTILTFLPQGNQYKVFERRNGLEKLVRDVNDYRADIAISFHFNSSSNSKANGFEVLSSGYPSSMMLSRAFLDGYKTSIRNRGIKVRKLGEDGGYFLNKTNMPAILLEPFFGSNRKDCHLFFRDINLFTNAVIDVINKAKDLP